MHTNLEQEFKTMINEEQYNKLIAEFNLENNIYKQTNYYFDTPNHDLMSIHTVLRIREKTNSFKLTKKERGLNKNEALETHIFLNEQQAKNMLENGLDAQIIDIDHHVDCICSLTTYRCKTAYKDGTLFFDRNEYYGNVDYEIEYEVDNIEQGTNDFIEFLKDRNIKLKNCKRKSERAYDSVK